MKTTKKQIEDLTQVIQSANVSRNGKYQIMINGRTYDNYSIGDCQIVSHPEGDYDTPLTKYNEGSTTEKTNVSLSAGNKKDFIANVLFAIKRDNKC